MSCAFAILPRYLLRADANIAIAAATPGAIAPGHDPQRRRREMQCYIDYVDTLYQTARRVPLR